MGLDWLPPKLGLGGTYCWNDSEVRLNTLCSRSCVSGKPYWCAEILIGTSPKSEIVFILQKVAVRIMASATPGKPCGGHKVSYIFHKNTYFS